MIYYERNDFLCIIPINFWENNYFSHLKIFITPTNYFLPKPTKIVINSTIWGPLIEEFLFSGDFHYYSGNLP